MKIIHFFTKKYYLSLILFILFSIIMTMYQVYFSSHAVDIESDIFVGIVGPGMFFSILFVLTKNYTSIHFDIANSPQYKYMKHTPQLEFKRQLFLTVLPWFLILMWIAFILFNVIDYFRGMVFIKGLGLMYIPYFCLLIVDLLFLFLSLYGAATAGWRAYKAPIAH